jgi:deoxyribonuclease V
MRLAFSHRWDLSIEQAQALQATLAEKVIRATTFDPNAVRTVAGVDVAFEGDIARAAAVVLSFPALKVVDSALTEVRASFPYVPGMLAFREGPSVLAALNKLKVWPDLLIFDAHGLAHRRRAGLAAHMGVILDWPSIGCAKSRLIGTHAEPGQTVGDWASLWDKEEEIGAVVRTRTGSRPLYVSIGHRVALPTAVEFVLRCGRGYRLPETTRCAHRLASQRNLCR